MVNWNVYKSIFEFHKFDPFDIYNGDNYVDEDETGFTFEEFKDRMTKSIEKEFYGKLEDGDIIGHDGCSPFYVWISEGMYTLNGNPPEEILWNHHESRNPQNIIDYFETYPNLFYRYNIVGNITRLNETDWDNIC
jgi:hypothetical protein